MSVIKATLVDGLASARRMSGWSKARLAEEAGVTAREVTQLEAGSGRMEALIAVSAAVRFQFAGIASGDTLGQQLANARTMRMLSIEQAAVRSALTGETVNALEACSGAVTDLIRLLAAVAPGVRAYARERTYWGRGDKVDRNSRFTPPEFMASVYDAFGQVNLDPCAHPMSPVVAQRRIIPSEGGDGLADRWSGRLAFVNPHYSKQLDWLKRAHQQWSDGNVQTVLCLAPVRTDNKFFHETLEWSADLFLLQGRLRFSNVHGKSQHTPSSLWIVALGATDEQKARFAKLVSGC